MMASTTATKKEVAARKSTQCRTAAVPVALLGVLYFLGEWFGVSQILMDYQKQEVIRAKEEISNQSYVTFTAAATTRQHPLYELTTTHYGWNTPADLNFSRRILSGEFFRAVQAHPHYNHTAWIDLEHHPDPNRTVVAFLDVDTNADFLYPRYIQRDWWVNSETEGGRTAGGGYLGGVKQSCQYIQKAAISPALLGNPRNRLIVLNCFGFPRHNLKRMCRRQVGNSFIKTVVKNDQVVFASYSEVLSNIRPNVDVGLPPPAVKAANLTEAERQSIQSCETRQYLFSFQGRGGYGRERFLNFPQNPDIYIQIAKQTEYVKDLNEPGADRMNYTDLLRSTTFGAAPAGDALYSYRFTETISAGAVPVVFTDHWLLPFNEHVVNWKDCAVVIAKADFERTIEIIRAIPKEQVCEMQKCALHLWDTYLQNRTGWVRGLVKAALAQSNITVDGAQ